MNQTLNISLAGFSFIIDEFAFAELQKYTQALRATLSPTEADEVMYDIELRMAEILKTQLQGREVVSQQDIKLIMAQLGSPEQIQEFEDKNLENPKNHWAQKSMFRDTDDKLIAGVCSGLGHYLQIDKVWVRLGMLLLLFASGFAVLLYPILWIVMPAALSPNDRLKMKGMPLSIDNLKEERSKGDFPLQQHFFSQGSPNAAKPMDWLLKALGALLILVAFLGCIFTLAMVFWTENSEGSLLDNLDFIMGDGIEKYLIMISSSLFVATSIGGLLVLGIKCLSPKVKFGYIKYVIGGLFVLSLLLGAVTFGQTIKYFENGREVEHKQDIQLTNSPEIIIDDANSPIPNNFKAYWDEVFSNGKIVYKSNQNNIDIVREDSLKTPYLSIYKSAKANMPGNKINVDVQIQGNKILLPRYISYDYAHRNQVYGASYTLHVPKGVKITNNSQNMYNNDIDDEMEEFDANMEEFDKNMEGFDKNMEELDKNMEELDKTMNNNEKNIKINIDENGVHGNINNKKIKIDENGVKISRKNTEENP